MGLFHIQLKVVVYVTATWHTDLLYETLLEAHKGIVSLFPLILFNFFPMGFKLTIKCSGIFEFPNPPTGREHANMIAIVC